MRSWTPSTQDSNERVHTEAKAEGRQKVRLTRPHPRISESTEAIRIENYAVMCRSATCPNEVRYRHDRGRPFLGDAMPPNKAGFSRA